MPPWATSAPKVFVIPLNQAFMILGAVWRNSCSLGGQGFCEHFAASFATLMRLADVPARVVMGYLGGDCNETSNYLTIRQSDAHGLDRGLAGEARAGCASTRPLRWLRLDSIPTVLTYLEGGGGDGSGLLARSSGVGRADAARASCTGIT